MIILDDNRAKEAPSLEQVKPRLTQQIQQQNLKKFLDGLKEKAKIEIVGEKAASASASASASAAATAAPASTPAAAAPAASK